MGLVLILHSSTTAQKNSINRIIHCKFYTNLGLREGPEV